MRIILDVETCQRGQNPHVEDHLSNILKEVRKWEIIYTRYWNSFKLNDLCSLCPLGEEIESVS